MRLLSKESTLPAIILAMIVAALIIKPTIRDFSNNRSELNLTSESKVDHLYFNIGKATKSMFFHELKARRY